MKIDSLLLISIFLGFLACKSSSELNPIANETEDALILKEIAALPEISVSPVKQDQFKKMEVRLITNNGTMVTVFEYLIDYYLDGKIKGISNNSQTMYQYIYQDKVLKIDGGNETNYFQLNDKGNADFNKGISDKAKFYYKNDFLIYRLDKLKEKFTYSTEGNLMKFSDENYPAEFEYTNYNNTIKQEVLAPMATHWTFRDAYFGRFSTNLIKKATFNKGSINETKLNFTYEFDENNRITKVNIDRSDNSIGPKYEYIYSY